MKLTKTGWNNVIIFAVMAYILLINTTQNVLFGDDAPSNGQQQLLPDNSFILSVTINGQYTIERIGQSWRSRPSSSLSEQGLAAIILAWQQSYGMEMAEKPIVDTSRSIIVTLDLAGQSAPEVVQLIPDNAHALVYLKSRDLWLTIAPEIIAQLIPNELIEY